MVFVGWDSVRTILNGWEHGVAQTEAWGPLEEFDYLILPLLSFDDLGLNYCKYC